MIGGVVVAGLIIALIAGVTTYQVVQLNKVKNDLNGALDAVDNRNRKVDELFMARLRYEKEQRR